MRWEAFKCVSGLAKQHPWLKTAVLKLCFLQTPKKGFCPNPERCIVDAPFEFKEAAHDMLKYFHSAVADEFEISEDMQAKRVQFLGNVDCAIIQSIVDSFRVRPAAKHLSDFSTRMGKSLSELYDRKLKAILGGISFWSLPTPPSLTTPPWLP